MQAFSLFSVLFLALIVYHKMAFNAVISRLSAIYNHREQTLITDHGYPVINMNCDSAVTSMNLDYANDFYDTRHVNVQGQIKTTKYLMNKFKNMYNLPDHRNDPLYDSWQHSYDSFISAPINPTVQSKNFVIMKGFK